jgi:hypothetical protein
MLKDTQHDCLYWKTWQMYCRHKTYACQETLKMPSLYSHYTQEVILYVNERSRYITKYWVHTYITRTPTRASHRAFRIPYVYDYVTQVCRKQAQVIQNHDNINVRSVGRTEVQHRKYKRLKLGGGQEYDRSCVWTAQSIQHWHNLLRNARTGRPGMYTYLCTTAHNNNDNIKTGLTSTHEYGRTTQRLWPLYMTAPPTRQGGRPTKDNTELFFQAKIWPWVTIRGSRSGRTHRLTNCQ